MLKVTKAIISFGVCFICVCQGITTARSNQEDDPSPYDSSTEFGSASLIISTVDGKVSALDMKNRGRLLWTVNNGDPLVQSSLTKLLIKEGEKLIRLIPSLNGELFRFDGKSVEAVPYTAEQLLSSSFRMAENQLLIGGKDITTVGLDFATGRTIYVCSYGGCRKVSSPSPNSDIIVVKRRQQVVRSVESRHGSENWNFSVGEVDINIVSGGVDNLLTDQSDSPKEDLHDYQKNFNFCHDKDHSDSAGTDSSECDFIKNIKVMVPEGTVCLVDESASKRVQWKHMFDSPIARAWIVANGKAVKINLFNPDYVPALNGNSVNQLQPTIYMGSYKDHVYIQASEDVQEAVSQAALMQIRRRGLLNPYHPLPRFDYHPYLGNGDHLTQATVGQASDCDITVHGEIDMSGKCGSSLAVYVEDVDVEKVGLYFKGNNFQHAPIRQSHKQGRHTLQLDYDQSKKEFAIDDLYMSATLWWKELLSLTVVLSICIQLLIAKCLQVFKPSEEKTASSTSGEYVDATSTPPNSPAADDHQRAHEYQSRFLNDFEPVQRLGKGGFGIVFEVKNKVDDCSYAVKRIELPKRSKAREKVMREVRALAKLDHPAIVRYFHSWTEEPPHGWKEKHDKQWMDDLSQTWTPTENSPYKHRNTDPSGSMINYYSNNENQSDQTDGYINEFGITGGFSLGKTNLREDSDSFIKFEKPSNAADESCKGRFFESNGSSSGTESSDDNEHAKEGQSTNKPFQRYGHTRGDSCSIVFENDDSAIDLDQEKNSDSKQQDFFSQTGNDHNDASFGIRKRSVSGLKTEDRNTVNYELEQVVCKNNSNIKRPESLSEDTDSPSTVYLYIQMQLCKKESLREWLATTTDRNLEDSLLIFQQVASAVEYVHDQHLIHRDLKPSNIFFSHDNTIKVGDFGLVTHLDDNNSLITGTPCHGSPARKQTSGHTEQVGTKMYMAPEQMSSSNYTQKVDIFALGLILIELFHHYGTQMERIRSLMDARKCKFSKNFKVKHPVEVELALKMLSELADQRPTASEICNHEVFDKITRSEVAGNQNAFNRRRTISSRSSESNSL